MTQNTTGQAPEFYDYNPVIKNYVLYRTVDCGWQKKGWVICNMQATSIDVCPEIDGAAWAEAPEGKYKSGNIFDPANT